MLHFRSLSESSHTIIGNALGTVLTGQTSPTILGTISHHESSDSPNEISPEMTAKRMTGQSGKPIVSVVMPFLDKPVELFEEAVDSVLSQTYPHWELLLVDDGSATPTTNAALKIAARDPERIIYLEHSGHVNLGSSASRNLGIRHSRGEYLAFLDADDVWLPNKLEQQVALIEAHASVGMLYGNTLYWHSWTGLESDARRDYFPRLGVSANASYDPPHLLTKYLRGDAAVPCTCSILVRRGVGEKVGWFDEAFRYLYDDQVFYARIILEAPVFVSDSSWDKYRQRAGSTSSSSVSREDKEARLVFLMWLRGQLDARGNADKKLERALREQLACHGDRSFLGIPERARNLRRRARKWSRRLFGDPS